MNLGLGVVRAVLPRRFRGDPVVPVVRLAGIIGVSSPLRPGLNLSSCAKSLERAFAYPQAKAVALVINSPGGSATQSHLIFKRIRALAAEKKLPVIAFIEDAGASGGYMIACAADEIVADESSIVGSIGVVGASFGFTRLIEKIGVERRLYTSGDNKAMLDPFLPENPDDVERLKAIQREIHDFFIDLVKTSRGAKLNGQKAGQESTQESGQESDLFSGEYWVGKRALELGLVDAIGDLRSVLRARYGDKVLTPLISEGRGLFGRRAPAIGAGLGGLFDRSGLAEEAISALEARALWARYGL